MEAQAFRRLALAELDAVHRLAYHLLLDEQEAGDAVQETYLRALKAGGRFELTEQGLRPWLFTILHNVVSTHASKRNRQPSLVSDFDGHAAKADGDGDAACWEVASLNWDDLDQRLGRAIRELPLAYRTAFLLSAVEGLRYRQIAEVTEVPVATVTSRLYRARQILACRLGEIAAERGMVTARPHHAKGGMERHAGELSVQWPSRSESTTSAST